MTGGNRYRLLRQLGILMALDTAMAVAAFLISDARIILTVIGSHRVSVLANGVVIYFQWTLWALRMLARVLVITLLSRLRELRESFGMARIWYLLRILYVAVTPLSLSVVNSLRSVAAVPPLLNTMVIFGDLTLWALAEILLPTMGSRAILRSCGELLETFGMREQAEADRVCARRLLWLSLALAALLMAAAAISAAGWMTDRTLLLTARGLEGFPAALALLALLDRAAAALCVPAMAGVTALRFQSAFQVDRTYRMIEELTR